MADAFDPTTHVHPELRPLLPSLLGVIGAGPLTIDRLPAMRATVPPFLPPAAATPTWRWQVIPGLPGRPDVRVLLVDPDPQATAARPAILHCHGGGFIAGGAEASLWSTQALARDLGAFVVSVEYRLAPETPFPGALDDTYAALAWLQASAGELAVDPARIAVASESAGGGHAAMLAIAARDRGEHAIAAQALVYPMLDDRTGSIVQPAPPAGTVLWDAQRNRLGWTSLLGVYAGSDGVPAGAVPARVTDLSGLPPTWIGVGSIDLFHDEDVAYACRLADAGVAVTVDVVAGAFHVFDVFDVPVARAFRARLTDWLRIALG